MRYRITFRDGTSKDVIAHDFHESEDWTDFVIEERNEFGIVVSEPKVFRARTEDVSRIEAIEEEESL